jgi:hypothetical protein
MRALRTAGAAVAAALVLTACSSTPAPAPATSAAPSRAAVAEPAAPASSVPGSSAPARPAPVNHCAGNHAAQKAIVSLRAQHMWMCARHRTVYSTAITSGAVGAWTRTPTGTYMVQGRNRDTTLTLNTGATYAVKYWIPFDAPMFGFHDSSWQHFPYGSPRYRTAGSHGCVHMPLKAIAFFYRWVARPTAVHIF